MKDFKSKNIITHDFGQIMFPNEMTLIESKKYSPGTNVTTANIDTPMIGITPYGAYTMQPGLEYSTSGNATLEIPMAQMGGQDDQQAQLMQLIQVYAQMKQIDPNTIIQQLQNMSEEQRAQSLQAIVQEVQMVMQEQQMQQQQMGEEPGMDQGMMPMAKDGGCMDCQEQFPQAQNLNWFYKAMTGGEAFPQANKYPESWANYSGTQYASGGPLTKYQGQNSQIKTLTPEQEAAIRESYARMGAYGNRATYNKPGYDDYQQQLINFYTNPEYNIVSKLDSLSEVYTGVNNPMYNQITPWNEYYDPNSRYYKNIPYTKQTISGVDPSFLNEKDKLLPENTINPYYRTKAQGGEAFPQAQTYLPYDRPGETRPNFMFEYGGESDIDMIYNKMKAGGYNLNPKKKNGKEMTKDDFISYVKNGGLPKFQGTDDSQYTIEDYVRNHPTGTGLITDDTGQMFSVSPERYLQMEGMDYLIDPDDPEKTARAAFRDQAFDKEQRDGSNPSDYGLIKNYNMINDAIESQNLSRASSTPVIDNSRFDYPDDNTTNNTTTPTVTSTTASNTQIPMRGAANKNKQGYNPTKNSLRSSPSKYYEMITPSSGQGFFPKLVGAIAGAATLFDGFTGNKIPNWMNKDESKQSKVGNYLRNLGKNVTKPGYGIFAKAGGLTKYQGLDGSTVQMAPRIEVQSVQMDDPWMGVEADMQNQLKQREGKTKKGLGFDTAYASKMVGSANKIGDFFSYMDDQKELEKLKKTGLNTSGMIQPVHNPFDRGNYLTNPPQGTSLRPNQMQYAQDPGGGMMEQPAFYDTFNNMKTAKRGGTILDMFEEGGVYDLDERTIKMIKAAGGKVEYI
jgi:hypothetical protein